MLAALDTLSREHPSLVAVLSIGLAGYMQNDIASDYQKRDKAASQTMADALEGLTKGTSRTLSVSIGINVGFDLDLIVVTRSGKKPTESRVAVGDRTLFEKRLFRFRQVERCFQSFCQDHRVVIRPEMHEVDPRLLVEQMAMERRDRDAVIA